MRRILTPASIRAAVAVVAAVASVAPVASFVLVGLAAGGAPAAAATSRALRATDAARDGDPVLEDAVIAYEVRSALIQELAQEALDLEVQVSGGLVRVSGRVADAERGARALRAIEAVRGVKHVEQALALGPPHATNDTPPAPQEAADALLEARVKTRLLRDLGPRAYRLAVEANRGEVTLGGRIPSREDKRQVVQAALRVPGVREVADQILVDRRVAR